MIRTGDGNLLLAQTDALVNTVNCEGVMGKGIALQFKKAWPAMFEDYRAAARAGAIQPGRIHVWPTGQLHGPKFILNFPTKRQWRMKSRMEDIEAGLDALVVTIGELGLRSIAIPPLGAGNGGLAWTEVRARIVASLEALEDVEVYVWNPGAAPSPRDQPVRAATPSWTPARAVVVALMGQYRILDSDLTQLEVQKLAYFLQEAGCDLRLTYQRHLYGPYADQLYHLLQRLEGHFIHGLQDRRPAARLTVEQSAVEAARHELAHDSAVRAAFDRVARLIEGFETPYGMELLATVHWVARELPEARTNPDDALKAVHAWSARKRALMEPRHVRIAWERLEGEGWLRFEGGGCGEAARCGG